MSEPEDKGSRTEDEQPQSDEAATDAGDREAPGESFKKGVGLLWRAARAAAEDVKNEVSKAGLRESLEQAGRELEVAAQQAAKALEEFVDRAGPNPPKPDYADEWPPKDKDKDKDKEGGDGSEAKQADADIPKDGGKTKDGERRDMRIQLEDDD